MKLELDKGMIDKLIHDLMEIPARYSYNILVYLDATIEEQNKPEKPEQEQ